FQGCVLGRFGAGGIEPQDVDIVRRRAGWATVQVVPDGIPDEACADPAVGSLQGSDKVEGLPPQWVVEQDRPKRCGVEHGVSVIGRARSCSSRAVRR
ncbi:MAG: hypothetical protein QOD93_4044, partial [Acetobacteraceae bacterium]|nr:hypothetical protein [Acetobacteraceae bacterium]